MHSSAEESGGDGEPVEEVHQVHSGETEPITIPAVVTTGGTPGPTTTATTTTPTAPTSTATSASASLPKKHRCSGFISGEDEDKMI